MKLKLLFLVALAIVLQGTQVNAQDSTNENVSVEAEAPVVVQTDEKFIMKPISSDETTTTTAEAEEPIVSEVDTAEAENPVVSEVDTAEAEKPVVSEVDTAEAEASVEEIASNESEVTTGKNETSEETNN